MPSICQYPVFRWTDDINTLGFVLKIDMILVADLLPTDLSDIWSGVSDWLRLASPEQFFYCN